MRPAVLLVPLLGLVLADVSRGQDDHGESPSAPGFSIELEASRIALRGSISSLAHEAILRQTTASLFADRNATYELDVKPALPPGWALMTELTLRALAGTRRATAAISTNKVIVRGFASSDAAWDESAKTLRDKLSEDVTLIEQVVTVGAPASMNRQCIELFRTALRGRRIEFEQGSAELRTSAAPLLDELIQIAVDCPDARLLVTGHTDNTGDEAVNVALSRMRADAVAAYLAAGGVAASRIEASGVGSSEPLVQEENARARRLNRRIELDIRFP